MVAIKPHKLEVVSSNLTPAPKLPEVQGIGEEERRSISSHMRVVFAERPKAIRGEVQVWIVNVFQYNT